MDYPEGFDQLSKHERKEFKRHFYREQQQKQASLGQIKKYGITMCIFLFVLWGGYVLFKELSKPQPGEFVISLGNKHIQRITDEHETYNSLPPTSGTHVGGKASWGVSSSPIPDELQLHNLEDGGVGIQFNCAPGVSSQNNATPSAQVEDECKQLVDVLATIAKKYPDKVFMAPYPALDTRIALTAWTRIDKFNDIDVERIEKFIQAFKGIDHH